MRASASVSTIIQKFTASILSKDIQVNEKVMNDLKNINVSGKAQT
jgi:hypothetical protein